MAGDPNKVKIGSSELWKSLVYDYLSANKRGKSHFYEHLRTNYKCQKSVCLEMYDKYEKEFDISINGGKDKGLADANEEAVKLGLKSKFAWVAQLQKELDENIVIETIWDFKINKEINYTRTMTPTERKGHMERISKFMGMDAPTKVANTDIKGENTANPFEKLIEAGGKIVINGQ